MKPKAQLFTFTLAFALRCYVRNSYIEECSINEDRCVRTSQWGNKEYSCGVSTTLTAAGYRDNDCSNIIGNQNQGITKCICNTDLCSQLPAATVGKFFEIV